MVHSDIVEDCFEIPIRQKTRLGRVENRFNKSLSLSLLLHQLTRNKIEMAMTYVFVFDCIEQLVQPIQQHSMLCLTVNHFPRFLTLKESFDFCRPSLELDSDVFQKRFIPNH